MCDLPATATVAVHEIQRVRDVLEMSQHKRSLMFPYRPSKLERCMFAITALYPCITQTGVVCSNSVVWPQKRWTLLNGFRVLTPL